MRVLLFKVGESPRLVFIQNTLKALQDLVDGRIECHNIFCEDPDMNDMAVICDEEGLIKGKPYNCRIKLNGDFPVSFCGDIVVLSTSDDDFLGISDRQIVKLLWDLVVRS